LNIEEGGEKHRQAGSTTLQNLKAAEGEATILRSGNGIFSKDM
jgi:hypothetical protein